MAGPDRQLDDDWTKVRLLPSAADDEDVDPDDDHSIGVSIFVILGVAALIGLGWPSARDEAAGIALVLLALLSARSLLAGVSLSTKGVRVRRFPHRTDARWDQVHFGSALPGRPLVRPGLVVTTDADEQIVIPVALIVSRPLFHRSRPWRYELVNQLADQLQRIASSST